MIRPITIGLISSQRGDISSPLERDITAIAPPNAMQVDYGTEFDELILPTSVIATLSDGSLISLPVSWEEGNYDHATDGTYALIGTPFLPLGITNPTFVTASLTVTVLPDFEYDVYVETSGNGGDDSNSGTSDTEPLLTPEAAVAKAVTLGGPRVIKFGTGEFTVSTYMNVPPLVSMIGDGVDNTIFKGASGLNFSANIGNPLYQWGLDKFLINFISGSATSGIQFFRDIAIDGDSRAKHGGIYIKNRDDLTIRNVKVTNFNVCGLWAIDTDALQILDCDFTDCSQSISEVSTGAIMLGNNSNTTIDGLVMDEGRGYGIKAFGPAPVKPLITNLRITRSHVSVDPDSAYGAGNIANIAVEFHDAYMVNCEVDNSAFDNVFSFVTPVDQATNYSNSATTLKFHHNTCDLYVRANNQKGYPMEVAAHNVEIYENHFKGGRDAVIAAWNSGDFTLKIPKNNWLIHSNTFEGQESFYPVGIVRSSFTPLSNFRFLNNTVYITDGSGPHTINVVMTERGMNNTNWTLRNNIILDVSTSDAPPAQGGANSLIKLDGGGSVTNLVVTHNIIFGLPVGSIVNGTYNNNITTSPQLRLTGSSPSPFLMPAPGSPAIQGGINVGLPFSGSAPTIGRYEFLGTTDAVVASVESLSDILVSEGTSVANINLPSVVNVTLDSTAVIPVAVTWDTSSYDPDTQDVYTFTGTLTMNSGLTNPLSLTASVNVIVAPALVLFSDSFDRGSIGSDYTVENITPTLDGSNMQFNGSTGVYSRRILRNDSIVGVSNIEISTIIQAVTVNTTSYGQAIGLQNIVNPNPNKGVFASFHLTTNADAGVISIWSGDSTTSNEGFAMRNASVTGIPVAVGNSYELALSRRIVGSDAVFTATARNVVTNATTSVTWTEVGAGSLVFEATTKVAIYHFGGLQQVNNLTAQNLSIASPFPNIVSVASVSPISEDNGTAFGSLGLPSTLQVTLSDESTPTYSINWELGNFSPTTARTYNLIGTIINPAGITNSDNVVALVNVTIEPPTVDTTFTYYVDADAADTSGVGTIGDPFKEIQQAASILTAGQSVAIRGGTGGSVKNYREDIVPANSGTAGAPITYSVYPGETAVISGFDVLSTSGWTVHSGNIYKKTITMPVNGFNTDTNLDLYPTKIFANQILRDDVMMVEARWPKITTGIAPLLARTSYRQLNFDAGFNPTNLTDNTLPLAAPNLIGATLRSNGWFAEETKTITGHSGNTLSWATGIWDNTATGRWARKRYYLTGKLALLTQAGEWHYESGTLYFWQPGNGTPTGDLEYKVRNVGFDARGKSYITIAGLSFKGCDPFWGNAASTNAIIDNTRAYYNNHHVRHDRWEWQGVGMSKMFGTKLLGANSVFKNNEWHSTCSSAVWLGPNCRAENNLMHDMGYAGHWAHPFSLWDVDGGQVVTRNTIYRTGRSSIDFGFGFGNAPGTARNFNVEISYNDMSEFGMLSADVGGTYTWGQKDLFGLNYHHNLIYDSMSPDTPGEGGIQVGIYFDQATGPGRIHHNVTWNVTHADLYHEVTNTYRMGQATWTHPDPRLDIYNNTFAGSGPTSYRTYDPGHYDVQRNNIYRSPISVGQYLGGNNGNTSNSVLSTTNPLFVGGSLDNPGAYFQLQAGSPARGIGLLNYTGATGLITDATSDAGAFPYGVTPWTAGYVAIPFTEQIVVDPGAVDLDSIDTALSDFDIVYNTAFGTNGAGLGLPQTIDVTFDDASTGTMDITWAVGSYSPTDAFYADEPYTIVGTPVLTGDITNTGNLTLSVEVTVKTPWSALQTSTIAGIWDTGGLVTNTTNDFGTVNSGGGITLLKSLAPGPLGRDMMNGGTAPQLSGGKAVLIGSGAFREASVTTDFHFMHYNATPANLKWTYITITNQTDTNTTFAGIMGNNGNYNPNRGVSVNLFTNGGSSSISVLVTNGNAATSAISWGTGNVIPLGSDFQLTIALDNSLAAASGKVKAWIADSLQTATSSGNGVLDNSVAPGRFNIGDYETGGNNDTVGTFSFAVILQGVESDAVLAKLRSDIRAYKGL